MPTETEAQRAARYAAKDVLDKLGVKPGDALLVAGTDPLTPSSRWLARGRARPPSAAESDDVRGASPLCRGGSGAASS